MIERWFGGIDRTKLGGIAWLSGIHASSVIVGLLTVVLAAPILGVERFAIYAYVFSIASILALLAVAGEAIVVRRLVSEPEERDLTMGAALGVRMLGALLSTVVLIGAVALFGGPPGTTVLHAALASLIFVASSLTALDAWAKSRERYAFLAVPKIAASLVFAAFIAVLVVIEAGLDAFVALRGAYGLIVGLMAVIAYRALAGNGALAGLQFDRARMKGQVWDMLPITLAALMISIQTRIDQVMLGQISTAAQLAPYAVSATLLQALAFVPLTVRVTFFPSLIRAHDRDPEGFDAHMQRVYDLLALGAFACMAGLGLAATLLYLPVFGEDLGPGLPMLMVLLLSLPASFLLVGRNRVLTIRGWLWTNPAVSAVGMLTNIGLNLLLIPEHGGIGAAWATVMSQWFAAFGVSLLVPRLRPVVRGMGRALVPWQAASRVIALAGAGPGR